MSTSTWDNEMDAPFFYAHASPVLERLRVSIAVYLHFPSFIRLFEFPSPERQVCLRFLYRYADFQLPLHFLLIWSLFLFLIAQFCILCNWLRILPGIRKQRILLRKIRILKQCFSGVLISHTAERYTLVDMCFVWLTLHKRSHHRYLRSSRVAGPP
jgi:hypothetical protein